MLLRSVYSQSTFTALDESRLRGGKKRERLHHGYYCLLADSLSYVSGCACPASVEYRTQNNNRSQFSKYVEAKTENTQLKEEVSRWHLGWPGQCSFYGAGFRGGIRCFLLYNNDELFNSVVLGQSYLKAGGDLLSCRHSFDVVNATPRIRNPSPTHPLSPRMLPTSMFLCVTEA